MISAGDFRGMARVVWLVSALLVAATPAIAQQKPQPKPAAQKPAPAPAARDNQIGIRGFASIDWTAFAAKESFEAVLGTSSGLFLGGGVQVLLPKGAYAEVRASRFKKTGERVFVGPNDEVFPLGIPLDVTMTPIEISGGWRYRLVNRARVAGKPVGPSRPTRFVLYGGGGFTTVSYEEVSEGDDASEEFSDRFSGFHILGGGEYQLMRWLAVGGEVAWSTIADALGEGGVSAAFDEDNLGGTSFRLKISIGR